MKGKIVALIIRAILSWAIIYSMMYLSSEIINEKYLSEVRELKDEVALQAEHDEVFLGNHDEYINYFTGITTSIDNLTDLINNGITVVVEDD